MTVARSRTDGPAFAGAEILERPSVGVLVVDRDWTYVFANPAGAARLASTPRALVGRNIWTVSPDAIGSDFERGCRRAMHDREPVALELRRRGSDEWSTIRVVPCEQGITIYDEDVSEQHRSKNAAERLAAIVESSDDAILSQALDGTVLTWNAAAERMFGYRAAEIVGSSVEVMTEPELLDERRATMARVAAGERVEHELTRRIRKDGARVEVSLSVFPVFGDDGVVVGSASIARDVSAQRLAEQSFAAAQEQHVEDIAREARIARDAESRLRSVLDAMAEGVMETTLDGHIVTVNQAFATLAGFSSPEEVIANVTDLSTMYANPGQRDEVIQQALSTPGLSRADVELKTADGRRVWVRAKFRPRYDDDGTVTGLHVVAEDVTATRAAEAAVRESEELLHFAFHDNPMPLVVIDFTRTGRVVTEANAALEEMLGYGPGDLAGTDVGPLIPDNDRLDDEVRWLAPIDANDGRISFESRRRHRDGHWVPVAVTALSMRTADGRRRAIAALEDITRLRASDDQRRAALELVETRVESEQAIADLARLMLESTDFDVLGRTACGLVARILDVDFCAIMLPVDDGTDLDVVAEWGWDRRLLATIGTASGSDSQASEAIRSGTPVIVDDWSTETRFTRSPLLEAHDVRSGLVVPIRHDRRSVGAVGIQTRTVRRFDDLAVRFLESVAQLVGIALDQERIRDLLIQSEGTLQSIVDNAPVAIHVLDPKGRFLLVNRELERIIGMPRDLLLGKTRLEVPALRDDAPIVGLVDGLTALDHDAPIATEQTTTELDGTHSFLTVNFPLVGADDRRYGIGGISTDVTALVRSRAETRAAWLASIARLARVVELRDDSTGAHIERMAEYAELLAHLVGIPDERCAQLRIVAPMHDLGKIAIPDRVLLKRGPLTPHERSIMGTHPEVGFNIMSGSGSEILDLAATIAYTHHEWFDGSGYPRGLVGADIPIEARVVAVADTFDALSSDRVYRKALTVERSIEVMQGEVGHFDPEILRMFVDHLDEFERVRARFASAANNLPPDPTPLTDQAG